MHNNLLKKKILVLEGGGILGLAYVGAIKRLEELHVVKRIKTFAGSSAGSIVAALLACGAKSEWLQKKIHMDYQILKDDSWGIIRDIKRLVYEYGVYKGDSLLEWMGNLFKELTGNADITFKQVYEKYGNTLIVTVSDLNISDVKYLSHKKIKRSGTQKIISMVVPDMPIRNALRMSMSIPLFYRAVTYEGDVYVDGGLLNNYPLNLFENQMEEVLGLKLLSSDEGSKYPMEGFMKRIPISGIKEYVTTLINCVRNQALKIYDVPDAEKVSVVINVGKLSFVNFALSDEEKKYLVENGYIAVDDWMFSSKRKPRSKSHYRSNSC